MKAIVTGGAGFIGSHIAEKLIGLGHEVVIIDDLSSGYESNIPDGARFLKANILHNHLYKSELVDTDVVFHNAASKKNVCLVDPEYDLEVNAKGTLRLLLACKEAGVKSFIHASTGSVYGEASGLLEEDGHVNPVSYYGISKLAGEKYARVFASKGINVVMIRYFHVYGSRQEDDPTLGGVVSVFKRQIAEGGPITIHGDGSQKRVFTHVDDVVEANLNAWHQAESLSGNVYNCASNVPISIISLAGILIRQSDKKIRLEYCSPLEGDVYHFDVDNSRIIKDLSISFTPFKP